MLGDWIGWMCLIVMIAFMLHEPVEKLLLRVKSRSHVVRPARMETDEGGQHV
jgi:hypothetical protein